METNALPQREGVLYGKKPHYPTPLTSGPSEPSAKPIIINLECERQAKPRMRIRVFFQVTLIGIKDKYLVGAFPAIQHEMGCFLRGGAPSHYKSQRIIWVRQTCLYSSLSATNMPRCLILHFFIYKNVVIVKTEIEYIRRLAQWVTHWSVQSMIVLIVALALVGGEEYWVGSWASWLPVGWAQVQVCLGLRDFTECETFCATSKVPSQQRHIVYFTPMVPSSFKIAYSFKTID